MRPATLLTLLTLGLAGALGASPSGAAVGQVRRGAPGLLDASAEVQAVAGWVIGTRDHRGLPFAIIDKRNARVFVFGRDGGLLGSAAALLGAGRGDVSVPGIGQRRLATILPHERITPAGRYQASLGHDLDQDILWIDYDQALSLHRVIEGRPADRRRQRLASPTSLDNRISYGCVNVPAGFYDQVVAPAFADTVGIVYILPESRAIHDVFPEIRTLDRN